MNHARVKDRQVTDLDVTDLVLLSGPGFRSVQQMLCEEASCVLVVRCLSVWAGVLGLTELCKVVWNPGSQNPKIINNETTTAEKLNLRTHTGWRASFV